MRHFLLATTAAVAIAAPMPAFAQTADADSPTEIIVTARQRSESLLNVPVPVTVATAEQISRDKISNYTDLQRITPALEISQTSGGESNGGARLRGLGTGVFNNSVSPSVAFVVNQVPQGNLTFPLMFDVAQVEVLRGPQGTLFGQGASAGVVNITTVAPTTDGPHMSAGVDYADKGTGGSEVGELKTHAAFNVPLGDMAAIRVATQYNREVGLQRNTALGLDNKISDYGVRVHALLKPSDNFTANIIGEYTENKTNGWNFFAIATTPNSNVVIDPDGPGPAPALPVRIFSVGDFTNPTGCNIPAITERAEFYCEDAQAQFRTRQGGISVRLEWALSDAVTLTSVSSYRQINRDTVTVNFSRRLGIAARNENISNEARQFSQELRLGYKHEGFDLVAGAMYSDFQYETSPIRNIPFGTTALGTRTGFGVCANAGFFCVVPQAYSYEKTNNNIKAIFADATVSVTESFDLFGGLRFSDYTNTTGVGVNTYAAPAGTTERISDQNVSGRIGGRYKLGSQGSLFASYAKGYKPPAIVVQTIAGQAPNILRPEKADAFEIGGRMNVGRLQLSANAFYTKVKDFQTQDQVNVGGALVSRTRNISEVTSKGFEIGAYGKIGRNFSLNAGYQFNDVRFPAGFLGNDSDPIDAAKLGGTQFVNAPKHKFTLSGEFTLPVGDTVEVFTNANVVYKSAVLLAQYGNPAYRYPSHALINGSIGFRNSNDRWSASIFVRNLTKQREPTAYLASDFAGVSDGGLRAWPVAGLTARVVGVSGAFKF